MCEDVDECMAVLDDICGATVGEFVGNRSCKTLEVGSSVSVLVSDGVSVAAEFWLSNTGPVPAVEEEPLEVLSTNLLASVVGKMVLVVMSVLAELLCVLSVAVWLSAVAVCVNGEDVEGGVECAVPPGESV